MCKYLTVNTTEINIQELIRTGYHIIHVPYFAMYGHTRTKWQLDPKQKIAIDAAPERAEAFSCTKNGTLPCL